MVTKLEKDKSMLAQLLSQRDSEVCHSSTVDVLYNYWPWLARSSVAAFAHCLQICKTTCS